MGNPRLVDVSVAVTPTLLEVGESFHLAGKATPALPAIPGFTQSQLPQPPRFLLRLAAPVLPSVPVNFHPLVEGPSGGIENPSTIVAQDGTYDITLTPSLPAEYSAQTIASPYDPKAVLSQVEAIGQSAKVKATALRVGVRAEFRYPATGLQYAGWTATPDTWGVPYAYFQPGTVQSLAIPILITNETEPAWPMDFAVLPAGDWIVGKEEFRLHLAPGETWDGTIISHIKILDGYTEAFLFTTDLWHNKLRDKYKINMFFFPEDDKAREAMRRYLAGTGG